MKTIQFVSTLIAGLLLSSLVEGSTGISYHGRLLLPSGEPVRTSTQFKIQIRTPGTENCLMYEETTTRDLSQSDGVFSITIGDGTGTRTDTMNWSLDKIFANRSKFTFTGDCAVGTEYTPNIADGRRLSVAFNDGTFAGWEELPLQQIGYSPISLETVQVGGFKASHLLRVQDAGGEPQNVAALTPAYFAELVALAAGTSTTYLKAANDLTIPGKLTATEICIGADCKTAWPAGGGSGTVTDVTSANAYLTVTNGTSTPQLTLNVGTAANTVAAGDDSRFTDSRAPSGTAGGDLSGTYPNPAVAKIQGNAVASGTIPGADVGKVYRWNGTALQASYLNFADLKTVTGSSQLPAACAVNEKMQWNVLTDAFTCEAIGLNANQITAGTIDPARLPASANLWQSGAASTINYMAGNVGIGTATPSEMLEVAGKIKGTELCIGADCKAAWPAGATPAGGDREIQFNDAGALGAAATLKFAAPGTLFIGQQPTGYSTDGSLYVYSSAARADIMLRSSSTGNTASDGGTLAQVFGDLELVNYENGYIGFKTNNTERVRILAGGNVGIGTSVPSERLEVNGRVKATELCIGADCKAAWPSAGGSGTVTEVTSANAYLTVATGTTTPALTLNVGTAANTVAAGDDSRFTDSRTPTGTAAGDLDGTYPNPSVAKIQGNAVASGTISGPDVGKVYRWDGTNLVATFLNFGDLRTAAGAQQLTAACAANEKIQWSVITDAFTCQTIGSLDASAITTGTIDAARLPASATAWDVGGGNVYRTTGKVGIGTNAPSKQLHIHAPTGAALSDALVKLTVTDSPDDGTGSGHADYGAEIGFGSDPSTNLNNALVFNMLAEDSMGQKTSAYIFKGHDGGDLTISGGTIMSSNDPTSGTPLMMLAGSGTGANANGGAIALYTGSGTGVGTAGSFGIYTGGTRRFSIMGANGKVGVGSDDPATTLHVFSSQPSSTTQPDRAGMIVEGEGTSYGGRIAARTYSSTEGPIFSGYRALNTKASPTAVTSGKALVSLLGYGFDGTNWSSNSSSPGITLETSEVWSGTAKGSRIIFGTTANTTTAVAERMRIDHNGRVGIGTTTPTEMLEVSGKVKATELCIGADCKAAWPAAGSGTVTDVTSANAYLTVATGTTTPALTLNVGTVANTVAAGDDARFTDSRAPSGAAAGDLSGTYPDPTVAKIQGNAVASGTIPGADIGKVYRWNGVNLVATFLNFGDLRTAAGAQQLTASCAANEKIQWSVITDAFTCETIGSLNASTITAGTIDAARLPASATYWQDGGSNRIYYSTANVGIGVSAPVAKLEVAGAIRVGTEALTCDSTTKGSMRYIDATGGVEICNGTSWALPTNGYAIPASATVVMDVCPSGWTDVGVTGGGPGSATCNGITCRRCQAPATAALFPAGAYALFESCPAGWTNTGVGSSSALAGLNIAYVSCTPATASTVPAGARMAMETCPASWADLGLMNSGPLAANCGAANCHACEAPGSARPRSIIAGISTLGAPLSLIAGTSTEGAGGDISILAGAGGTSTATARVGGNITLTAGLGVSNGNGGNVYISSGSGNGTGVAGDILLNTTNGGKVGIGTATPGYLLDVAGTIGSASIETTTAGIGALYAASAAVASSRTLDVMMTVQNNATDGYSAISFLTSLGGMKGVMGYANSSAGSFPNSMAVASMDTSTPIVFGIAGVETARFKSSNGYFGVGVNDPQARLHVYNSGAGAVAAFQNDTGSCTVTPNTSSLSCSSDIRLKKNIESILGLDALNKVLNLQAKTYQWKNGDDGRHIGYIAQEVEQVVPELVIEGANGFKQVSYSGFVPLLSEAIKEVHQDQKRDIASVKSENAVLQKQVETLKKQNESLEARLQKLEALLLSKQK